MSKACITIQKMTKSWIVPLILLSLVCANNLSLLKEDGFVPIRLFAYQNSTYKNVKQVVDYTYRSNPSSTFGVCSVSNPLFINTLWSFAYSNKENHLPYWTGPKQELNINHLPPLSKALNKEVKTMFLIIEPQGGILLIKRRGTFLLNKQSVFLRKTYRRIYC
jgi:hypothetical protein